MTYTYARGKKSKIGDTALCAVAFKWFFESVMKGVTQGVEVRHAGSCGRCGRTLTTPESIDTGIGPHCASEMGVEWARRTAGKFDPRAFMLAGNATFTVTSKSSGTSFTYRIRQAKKSGNPRRPYFVSVLTSNDNENGYSYLGCIWER